VENPQRIAITLKLIDQNDLIFGLKLHVKKTVFKKGHLVLTWIKHMVTCVRYPTQQIGP
jgi:hypothetical protein